MNQETGKQVPLTNVDFEVDVLHSRFVSLQMHQTYINSNKESPIETKFYLPTDIDFTLSKIRVEYTDLRDPTKTKVVETWMEERKKADKIY